MYYASTYIFEVIMHNDLLTLEMYVPIEIKPLLNSLSSSELSAIATNNEHILTSMITLQKISPPQTGDQDLDRVFHNMDMKINLILELLTHIQSQNQELPDKSRIALNANRLYFNFDENPVLEQGVEVSINLYLEPKISMPLTFIGIVRTNRDTTQQEFQFCIDITTNMHKSLDLLERFIFTLHRRDRANVRNDKRD